ncbi:RDD family protein [bacterium]|nr:MAG: RDD family protein [bacterium]
MDDSEKAPPARFVDRLNAFLLDASLFSCGYFLSAVVLVALRPPEPFPRFYPVWMLLWTALLIAYHAYFAADDRRTLGKRLLGLQVVTTDDELPNLRISLVRALAYIPSSLFFFAGFLWALWGGRAWHDHIAGTWVAQVDERSAMTRRASAVVGGVAALVLVGAWFVMVVIGPSMARGKLIAHGEKGVKSVVYLETKFKAAKGAYTADPAELFALSDEAAQIAKELPLYIDMTTLILTAGPEGLAVEASALDEKRTVLRAAVP